MILDSHTHVWPDKVAKAALGKPSGELERKGDGTVAGLLASMDRAGVERSVVLGVGNTADKVASANRWVGSLDPARFVGFGSIHPDLSVEENVAGLREHRLKGVKVHPLFQGYALDDPRLIAILDALRGEFAVVIHVGHGGKGHDRCTPQMLVDLVRELPDLDVIACHFGGYRLPDEVEERIIGLPVLVDTSWPPGIAAVDPARVRRWIERHGPERVIFGSDWPMGDPAEDLAAIRGLGLSDADTDAVLGGNLARVLRLDDDPASSRAAADGSHRTGPGAPDVPGGDGRVGAAHFAGEPTDAVPGAAVPGAAVPGAAVPSGAGRDATTASAADAGRRV
jgi:uncharacterized protein